MILRHCATPHSHLTVTSPQHSPPHHTTTPQHITTQPLPRASLSLPLCHRMIGIFSRWLVSIVLTPAWKLFLPVSGTSLRNVLWEDCVNSADSACLNLAKSNQLAASEGRTSLIAGLQNSDRMWLLALKKSHLWFFTLEWWNSSLQEIGSKPALGD